MEKFESAVARAVEVHAELRRAEARLNGGLSAPAFAQEAAENADIDEAGLDALFVALGKPGCQPGIFALNAMKRAIGDGQMRSSRPIQPDRCRIYCSDEGVATLASLGYTPPALYALAAAQMAVERPEHFGEVEDMDAAEGEHERLKGELADAITAIEESWGASDVEVGRDGSCRFRQFGVTLTSIDLGRRVLDAAVAEAAKAKAA